MKQAEFTPAAIIPAIVAASLLSCAAEPEYVLRESEREHITRALNHLNMKGSDLSFEKDVAEPQWALERVRRMLSSPLDMAVMADESLAAVNSNTLTACWFTAAHWLELEAIPPPAPTDTLSDPTPAWEDAVEAFRRDADPAHDLLQTAYAGLTGAQRQYLAAALLGGTFLIEDDPDAYRAIEALGISTSLLSRVILEAGRIDPQPAASNHLALAGAIDIGSMVAATHRLLSAVERLRERALHISEWPSSPVTVATPLGDIVVGTPGRDHHAGKALLILDPGGADIYSRDAGSANGLGEPAISVIIDLTGNDTYTSDSALGPGAALFGVAVLLDGDGNDVYRVAYTGIGAGIFGAASLADESGDDIYQALALAQGAGYAGIGILRDHAGNDIYDLGYSGQAYAGVRGIGMLVDDNGNDRYTAGGRHPDYDRHNTRYLSCAQGFAIGMRPFAGGGVAALIDRNGNDTYVADVFGQGVGYWYAIGMLIDEAGHDSYRVYEYGQGAGIHLSLGLLCDRAGNDRYSGFSLSQGCAHDYAAGALLDHAGNDTYTADHYSQGLAINNSLGILIDSAGNDAYFARQNTRSQGIGNDGSKREYGSLAMLLDLAGKDRYSCGAKDGSRAIRPNYGIVYDLSDE